MRRPFPPGRPGMRRPMAGVPGLGRGTIQQRAPVRRNASKVDKELDETLKKLRDMSK